MTHSSWWLLGICFFLLLLGALFSGTETALTAFSQGRMYNLAKGGNKRASLVNKLYRNKEQMISALLLSNTIVNNAAVALATGFLVENFGETGIAISTFLMTFLILVFAEVFPKTYALQHADKMALMTSSITQWIVWILSPITITISIFVRYVLELFDKHAENLHYASSEEELRGVIDLHQGEDAEEVKHERAMLRSILDLGNVEVSEIMIHRKNMATIDISLPATQIVDILLESPYTRVPIWKDDPDNIVGLLHTKALLREVHSLQGKAEKLDLLKIASKPWFIPDSTTLLEQLQAFRKRHEHFALVVDEYGTLMGMVTLEDILEEIVGEIVDEHDIAFEGVQVQSDGSYIIDGWVTLRDLNREFEWSLPDENASTLAGLILHEAQRIPEIGQVFNFYDFRFEILHRQRNQITAIRVVPPFRVEH